MKIKTIYTIAAVVLVAAVIAFLAYLLLSKQKEKKADETVKNNEEAINASGKAAVEKAKSNPKIKTSGKTADELKLPTDVFPLYKGSGMGKKTKANQYVKKVQEKLNQLTGAGIGTDGQWGDRTEDAAKKLFANDPDTLYLTNASGFKGNIAKHVLVVTRDQYAALYTV